MVSCFFRPGRDVQFIGKYHDQKSLLSELEALAYKEAVHTAGGYNSLMEQQRNGQKKLRPQTIEKAKMANLRLAQWRELITARAKGC